MFLFVERFATTHAIDSILAVSALLIPQFKLVLSHESVLVVTRSDLLGGRVGGGGGGRVGGGGGPGVPGGGGGSGVPGGGGEFGGGGLGPPPSRKNE